MAVATRSVGDLRARFGRRVAELRMQRGLTQHQLARACGVGLQFVQKLEQGERAPSFETLGALARGLHVELCDLFNWAGGKLARPRVELELLQLREALRNLTAEDAKLIRLLAERLGRRRARGSRRR